MKSQAITGLSAAPARLTKKRYAKAIKDLGQRDEFLARILSLYGPPPLWAREPGFPTLVHIILEQQVSLASAKAAFDRLLERANPLTPERFLCLDDQSLLEIGFSRQKRGYVRGISTAILNGDLDLSELEALQDGVARAELIKVRGIGPWTADIYLLMALRRPDIWPIADLALVKAIQEIMEAPAGPKPDELAEIGERWKPWRAVATRILWHYYLSERNQS